MWVYQYKYTATTGDTVPVCFVAMRVHLWRNLTREADTAEQLVINFDVLELTPLMKKKASLRRLFNLHYTIIYMHDSLGLYYLYFSTYVP